MKNYKKFFLLFFLYLLSILKFGFTQAPSISWARCFGTNQAEGPHSIQKTLDNGTILCGDAGSAIIGNHGGQDVWVVKLDSIGNLEWQKCYGGSQIDGAQQIIQTLDSCYFFAGTTTSNDSQVSGNHGTADFWVVKLDVIGNIIWQKCFGGTDGDIAYNMDTTIDGGCIVVGITKSNNGDVNGHHSPLGQYDIWVTKIDSLGGLQWQRCLGGSVDDEGWSVKQTSDGGYIVGGRSGGTNDGDITGAIGSSDFWLVKLSNAGLIDWQKCLGGTSFEFCYSVVEAIGGGFVAVGGTHSNDVDVVGNHGGLYDWWIVKVDSGGTIHWQKTYGGSTEDMAYDIEKTMDGGYIISGYTDSNDGDVTGNHSSVIDAWVVKLDSLGDLEWEKCLGGSSADYGISIIQSNDSGYLVGCQTFSNDGDVFNNHGVIDMWVVKLGGTPVNISSPSIPYTDFNSYFSSIDNIIYLNIYSLSNESTLLQLHDITGRLILSQSLILAEGLNKHLINAGALSRGIYLVSLSSERTIITRKVVVD